MLRYVRGLYRHDFSVLLPANSEFIAFVEPEAIFNSRTEIERVLSHGTHRTIQEGVFCDNYSVAGDNPTVPVWLRVFFDAYPVLIFVRRATSVAPGGLTIVEPDGRSKDGAGYARAFIDSSAG